MKSEAQKSLLEARLSDGLKKSNGGRVSVFPFFHPLEQKWARNFISTYGVQDRAWFFGGYPEAERKCLFLLPEYLSECLSALPDEVPVEEMADLLGEVFTDAVCAVRICGSGYRTLTHRDYLGALLGLGIERDALGDLAVQNGHEAVVFCSANMAEFIISTLQKVSSDTVKCRAYVPDADFTDGRKYQSISKTVASPRLDCVVAALTDLSREAAQNAVRTGLVEVDFEPEERPDALLSPPVTVSVRGHGRYLLRTFDGETRKGRIRLIAEKPV